MPAEYWTLLVVAAVGAAAAGFVVGRVTAAGEQRVRALEKERDAARAEAASVRAEVGTHFEESARMFGRLANDYRSFFEHFARTAQNLGMSEGRARELLHRADPRLVADAPAAARVQGSPAPGRGPESEEAEEAPGGQEAAADNAVPETAPDAGVEAPSEPARRDRPAPDDTA